MASSACELFDRSLSRLVKTTGINRLNSNGTHFDRCTTILDLSPHLATGIRKYALVSDGMFDWGLGDDSVFSIDRDGLAHAVDYVAGHGERHPNVNRA